MLHEPIVVFATFPNVEMARGVVRSLVEERLVACGNLIPKVESIYRWQGAVETSTEVFAVLKTERSRYDALEKRLRELHPYEVPECISVRIDKGLSAYLRWMADSTASA
jgi:periplasmic divalent cation tolerance protein